MICPNCEPEVKMMCRFSVPVGKRLRYRYHKCPNCEEMLETVEMTIDRLKTLDEDILKAILQQVNKRGRERRFLAVRFRKGAH